MSHDSQRLSRIATMWTMVRQAHASASGDTTARLHEQQRATLMERYCASVHRYLLGALRDEEAADELFQEFALRFLRGDFKRTDAAKGRFRDYVRTVLVNLVNDFHRSRKQSNPLPVNVAAPPAPDLDDQTFVESWRMELMDHAWAALEKTQPAYHAVLLYHVQNPDAESPELAEEMTRKLGKPMTAANVRVTLHRARERFAELLMSEVARSLEDPADDAELIAELKALNMHKVCESALEKRKEKREQSTTAGE